jgi:U3 small nucleolar RNA-associated protein 10
LWLLEQVHEHFDKETLKAEFKPVFKFLLQAFDLRRHHGQELDDVDAVEAATVGATMSLIVKLRESQLKALFLKMLEWLHLPVGVAAQLELSGGEGITKAKVDKCLDRAVVFFRLVLELITTLKHIFVPYFGHILEHCVLLLTHVSHEEGAREKPKKRRRKEEGSAEDATQPQSLLVQTQEFVLMSLQRCFEHDSERWLGKEFLTKISTPIVEQLELGASIRDREEYLVFGQDVLAPCVEELAVRMANATLWKPLNYAVLLNARSDHAVVRRATTGILRRFFLRLRESWLFLLPETIPFVAELMEDNDLLVERDIQLAIKDIETLSGESLEHYLK